VTTPSLDELPVGYRFPKVPFRLDVEWVRDYLEAVEDKATPSLGKDAAPPLAALVMMVRRLLELARLPEGSVHLGQELQCHRALHPGEELIGELIITGNSVRQSWRFLQVDVVVRAPQGEEVMKARATILSPVGQGQ